MHLRYESTPLGKNAEAYVILREASRGPFQVMFLLHGLYGDASDWVRKSNIERYVAGTDVMVVMPDGGRGYYLNAVQGFAYGTAIGSELPAIVDGYFLTQPKYWITGLSMGGYGAIRLAFAFPGRFASAAALSSAFYSLVETADASPEWRAEARRLVGRKPAGGPNDLEVLARQALGSEQAPRLQIDCGTEDHLLTGNRRYHRFLESIGYRHEYHEYPGDHTWEYWDAHVRDAIAFHAGE